MIKYLFNFFPFVNNNLYPDLNHNRTHQDSLKMSLLIHNSSFLMSTWCPLKYQVPRSTPIPIYLIINMPPHKQLILFKIFTTKSVTIEITYLRDPNPKSQVLPHVKKAMNM